MAVMVEVVDILVTQEAEEPAKVQRQGLLEKTMGICILAEAAQQAKKRTATAVLAVALMQELLLKLILAAVAAEMAVKAAPAS